VGQKWLEKWLNPFNGFSVKETAFHFQKILYEK